MEAARAALLAADRAFGVAAQEKGSAAAYAAVLGDDARLLRAAVRRSLGKEAVPRRPGGERDAAHLGDVGGGVARSGDLGYTYGFVKRHEEGPESPW